MKTPMTIWADACKQGQGLPQECEPITFASELLKNAETLYANIKRILIISVCFKEFPYLSIWLIFPESDYKPLEMISLKTTDYHTLFPKMHAAYASTVACHYPAQTRERNATHSYPLKVTQKANQLGNNLGHAWWAICRWQSSVQGTPKLYTDFPETDLPHRPPWRSLGHQKSQVTALHQCAAPNCIYAQRVSRNSYEPWCFLWSLADDQHWLHELGWQEVTWYQWILLLISICLSHELNLGCCCHWPPVWAIWPQRNTVQSLHQ